MSPFEGIAFLLAGVAVFTIAILFMLFRDRARQRPKQTVAHFQRSGNALSRIFRAHLARREAARVRARESHPAARESRAARHRQRRSA